ncbi:hypothetical protein [Pseudaminobacter soli (ex Li et al. 2025)]|uniref:Uncharacterized protein n=1 Tax=Pseudaminobacter soli (ex Li et al. 2025) TaxID=1295366 RepID=A0A2P7S957_9HYPH|nr:hypothetical protein [Mesorhizobium soli]PSJ59022.1 hypothetical protein C7I85_18490 [Mesorhizobium soli]
MDQATKTTGKGRRVALWATAAVIAIAAAGVTINKFSLERSISQHIAKHGGNAGSVQVDFLGRVHLRDVTLPFRSGSSVQITAIDGRPKILFLNGNLDITGLTAEIAGGKISIPHAAIEEANFDRQSLAEMFGPSELTLAKRIERFSAKRISAPEITVSHAMAGNKQKIAYTNVAFDDIARGHVAQYSSGGAVLEFDLNSPAPDGQTKKQNVSGTIGAISGKDFEAAYVARLYTEKAGEADNQTRNVYGPFSITDLAWTVDEGTFKYAEIRSGGFSVRMPAEPLLETLEKLQASPDPDTLTPAERGALFAKFISLVDVIDKGDIEMNGLKVSGPSKDKSQTIHFDVDRMTLQFDNSKLDASINGVSMGEGDDYVKLGEASVSGFSWGPTLEGLKKFVALNEDQMAAFPYATLLPEFGTIRIANLDVDLPHSDAEAVDSLNPLGSEETSEANDSSEIEAEDEANDEAYAASPDTPGIEENAESEASSSAEEQAEAPGQERIRLSLKNYEMALNKLYNGIPTDIRIVYDDLSLPVPENTNDEAYKQLRKLGYDKLTLSSRIEGAWDEASQNFVVKDVSIGGPDMGTISISGVIGGVTKDFFSGDVTRAQVATLGLKAREVNLKVEEKGLIGKSLALYAAESGMTVDEVRTSLALIAGAVLQEAAANQPKLQQAVTALSSFLAKPNILTMSVKAKSEAGIGVVEIATASQDPLSLLEKVDIEAKTE